MSGAHAKYSPSSAHRWMECLGSPILEAGYPNDSSKFADEGTAAHFLGSTCLKTETNARDWEGQLIQLWEHPDGRSGECWGHLEEGAPPVGYTVRESYRVEEEFIEGVQAYLNDVRDRAKGGHLFVEQKLDLSKTLQLPDQFGTGDAVIAQPDARVAIMADLKFGKGEQVYAQENHQLCLYGLGMLESLDIIYGDDAFDFITLVVIQPRIDWIDEWTISVADLRAFGRKAAQAVKTIEILRQQPRADVEKIVTAITGPDSVFRPGEKTCRWCKAKANCAALTAKISQEAFNDFAAIDAGSAPALTTTTQHQSPDEVIGRRMGILDLVTDWAKAVRAEGERRVFAGNKIIGSDGQPMKIVAGKKGDRAYVNAAETEKLLIPMVADDKLYTPKKLVSVAQLEKALGKPRYVELFVGKPGKTEADTGVPPQFPGHITQAEGSPSIALGSDRRPPLASAAVASEFEAEDSLCS